jgi:hypothetical protein
MKNQVKVTNKMMMVTFEFPLVVGQISMNAIGQAMITKNIETGKLDGDFEFMDHDNIIYMGMNVEGRDGWKKLKELHLELGINLNKLFDEEFDKVITKEFQKEFLSEFNFID